MHGHKNDLGGLDNQDSCCPLFFLLSTIHDALSYYYENREEIDHEIAEHEALDPGLRTN